MRFVIVTGMSGAGKSTALKELEDADYFCVDNLPAEVVKPFAEIASSGSATEYSKIAVGIDIRGLMHGADFGRICDELSEAGIRYEMLFLDASDEVLLHRYKETRRLHPLSGKTGSVTDGIAEERKLLEPVRERADHIIDTSKLYTHELRAEIARISAEENEFKKLYITVQSFGFKFGIPRDSDLVVDVRFIPNPYYQDRLRHMTGLDADVRDYVMSFPESREFIDRYCGLLEFLIPNYIKEGKSQLVISVGCTGGRHRSVAIAEEIAGTIAKDQHYAVRAEHRDAYQELLRKKEEYS